MNKIELTDVKKEILQLFNSNDIQNIISKIKKSVLDNNNDVYEKYLKIVKGDLSTDYMQLLFQYYLADRKNKMQDFTPKSIAKFVSMLTRKYSHIIDYCAGSGALTIQKWNENKDSIFECYEYDENVIPFLLFNLCVRNVDAKVVHCDILSQEIFNVYLISKGNKFSEVQESQALDIKKTKKEVACISNPPYNMKWELPELPEFEERFWCGVPPKNNANFVFVLTALQHANRCVFVLPNGILTSTNKVELEIRKHLINNNLIESVILLPDKMFESTQIPVCLFVLERNKKTAKTGFVDLRENYDVIKREQKGQYGGKSHTNRIYSKETKIISDSTINDVVGLLESNTNKKGMVKFASISDIKNNDYNLMPSRYIDLQFEGQSHREYKSIVEDLNKCILEKNRCKLTINQTLAKKIGIDISAFCKPDFDDLNKLLVEQGSSKIIKEDYFSTSKNKMELKFENKGDTISSILALIINTWTQHVYYLNNEENVYLAELRDALLPDLMSGKIEI